MRETKFCVNPLTGASKQIGEIAYNVFHHHHYKRCVVHSTQRPAAHLNDKSKQELSYRKKIARHLHKH